MVGTAALRIVFFGTPAFAVPTLDALLASRHAVVAVITQPDRPRGRGQKLTDAPVKARALLAGLPVLQPERLKDPTFLETVQMLRADLGVVVAYGKILTDAVLAAPRLGLINVHASLLPRYRGAAPVHRAIMAGERETGVTIMRVVKALDAGPMLAKVGRLIEPEETSVEVERDLAHLGARLLIASVEQIAAGRIHETPQDDGAATYAPRLTKSDGAIDWSWPAERIHNLIRGLHPWPHAYTFLHGTRLILLRSSPSPAGAEPSDRAGPAHRSAATNTAPGTIVGTDGDRLVVATGAGRIRLTLVQPEGKRPMTPRDFLAGHPVASGDRFDAAPAKE